MKITMMVVLILTIAAISHLAVIGKPTQREVSEQLPQGTDHPWVYLLIGSCKMWASIFAAFIIAAACLGIAMFVMQPAELV